MSRGGRLEGRLNFAPGMSLLFSTQGNQKKPLSTPDKGLKEFHCHTNQSRNFVPRIRSYLGLVVAPIPSGLLTLPLLAAAAASAFLSTLFDALNLIIIIV